MARVVNEAEHAAKRAEILDAAERLLAAKGYERMTVQDVLDEIGMSKGAFYHYFDSKQAVVRAFAERLVEQVEQALAPVADAAHRTGAEKLRLLFATALGWKTERKAVMTGLLPVWHSDANAVLLRQVELITADRLTPLVARVLRQGVEEGVFAAADPDRAARVVMALVRGLQDDLAAALLHFQRHAEQRRLVEDVVALHAAYATAVERLLHAPGALRRLDAAAVRAWLDTAEQATTEQPATQRVTTEPGES